MKIVFVFILSFCFIAFTEAKSNMQADSITAPEIYVRSEIMPSFPGGSQELMKFLSKNIRYPAVAMEYGFTGKMVVKFYVDIDGIAKNPVILRNDGCEECGAEVIRVVNSFPKWSPGIDDGNPVKVYYTLPVAFAMETGTDFNNRDAIFKGDLFAFREEMVRDINQSKGKKKEDKFIQTSFDISENGTVTRASIVTSDTDDKTVLDKITQGLLQSKWFPAIKDGAIVTSTQTLLFTF